MIRTLHCSTKIQNYNLCLDYKVAGFSHRGPETGDIIYLLFKEGKKTLCGARFVLDTITDEKPWEDADNYVLCYTVKNIEFCNFFDMSFLSQFGGKYWPLKYLQANKAFDEEAANEINKFFVQNKVLNRLYPNITENAEDEIETYTDEEIEEIEKNIPNQKINIMGTFQTVNFLNETDKFRGLERLVSENFYNLFPQYREENSILIADNRLFRTHQMEESVNGVPRIPDALLITFDEKRKECPIHISLIEYECYGEGKSNPSQKSKYMNSHIIPQLMQFASSFSIITDQKTRDTTIQDWIDKIIVSTEDSDKKIDAWMKTLDPGLNNRFIISTFEKRLRDAFKEAIHVFLIIDELSGEQKETIKNIIQAFKLESGADIQFDSAIVKLVQKINLLNQNYEYGLTAQ